MKRLWKAWKQIIGSTFVIVCIISFPLLSYFSSTQVTMPTIKLPLDAKQVATLIEQFGVSKYLVKPMHSNCVTRGTPTIESGPLTGEGRTLTLSIAYHMRNATQHPRLFTFYCAIFKVVGVKFPYTPSAVSRVIVEGGSSERGVVVIKWPKKMYRRSVLRRYVYTCACQHTRTMGERVIDMKFVSVPEEVK